MIIYHFNDISTIFQHWVKEYSERIHWGWQALPLDAEPAFPLQNQRLMRHIRLFLVNVRVFDTSTIKGFETWHHRAIPLQTSSFKRCFPMLSAERHPHFSSLPCSALKKPAGHSRHWTPDSPSSSWKPGGQEPGLRTEQGRGNFEFDELIVS